MLKKEEVARIAKLARLGLTEEEKEKFQRELSSILEYVEKLKKADTSRVNPVFSSIPPLTVKSGGELREDGPEKRQSEETENLVKAAPVSRGRHIQVKAVFE